jgi:gamma-glutamyl-gamma-aminobutyraldehyde dehydrogenase
MSMIVSSLVASNAALPRSEGPGAALSVEPHGQSGIGVESGLAGIRSYLRQQLSWVNY